MINERNNIYREILISPVRECASYSPKFGHGRNGGFSLNEFQVLYGQDSFYRWLGLDSPLMYSAHKAAGGITSIYRQIGIGCERLVRQIFMDNLDLTEDDVKWSYEVAGSNGKKRTLYLDGRIVFDSIVDPIKRNKVSEWKEQIVDRLGIPTAVRNAMTGVVFEVRQGYKSKDAKRQNADISNASNAYANGYIPCLMVISSQIDEDIVVRYNQAKWLLLQGYEINNPCESTFDFFNTVVSFDFVDFMDTNKDFFRAEINYVLEQLMRAE